MDISVASAWMCLVTLLIFLPLIYFVFAPARWIWRKDASRPLRRPREIYVDLRGKEIPGLNRD
jgi:hypothetical protein